MAGLNVDEIAAEAHNILQRPVSPAKVRTVAGRVTRILNDGGSMEINGKPVETPPLRVYGMIESTVYEVPAGRSEFPLPDGFGSARTVETDGGELRQTSIDEIAARERARTGIIVPGDGLVDYFPVICFEGGQLHFYTSTAMKITIHYWRRLSDAEEGNWVTDNAPDIYESGVLAFLAETVLDEERKNEQWILFSNSVYRLNRSRSENAGRFAPQRVRFTPMGGRRSL